MKTTIKLLILFACFVFTSCEKNKDKSNANSKMDSIKMLIEEGQQDSIALKQLIADANLAMQLDEFSVLDNSPVPPSGDRHDYYSWSPYLWPNPETPDGLPYIYKDGKTNPATDSVSDKAILRRMVMAVQTLSFAYFYTGKAEYASKANDFLRTWFLKEETKMNPHLQYAQCIPGEKNGQAHGVIDTRWFILLTESVDLLHEQGALSSVDYFAIQGWFKAYLDWLHTSQTGKKLGDFENNIGSWYMAQKAAYAVFTEQQDLAEDILHESHRFFTHQIDSLGRAIHELERTKSFDYSLYSLNALLTLLEMEQSLPFQNSDARKQHEETLRKAIQFMASFNDTDHLWPYPQIAEKAISLDYEDGIVFSVYYPYDLYYTLKKGYTLLEDGALLDAIQELSEEQINTHRANLQF